MNEKRPRIVAITEGGSFNFDNVNEASWISLFRPGRKRDIPFILARQVGSLIAFQFPMINNLPGINLSYGPLTLLVRDEQPVSDLLGGQRVGEVRVASHLPLLIAASEAVRPGVLNGNRAQVEFCKAIETRADYLAGALRETGQKDEFYDKFGWNVIKVATEQALNFETLIGDNDNPNDQFRGLQGQIKMASMLGNLNLGDLYGLASAFGVTEKLEWKKVALSLETVRKFEELVNEVNRPDEKYKGNHGQVQLARELDGPNLGGLFALGEGFGVAEKLNWSNLNVPLETVDAFLRLIGDLNSPNKIYIGNLGQLQLARDLKNANLQQVFSVGCGLLSAEVLGWTSLQVPLATAEKFILLVGDLSQSDTQFRGNQGLLEVARLLGGLHLTQLSSLGYGLGVSENLGWDKFTCSYKSALELKKRLTDPEAIKESYSGLRGQFKLAQELNIDISEIIPLARTFGDISEFGWKKVSLYVSNEMFRDLLVALDSIAPSASPYKGNKGQLELAKHTKITHLGSLYDISDKLGLAKELGWTDLGWASVSDADSFLERVLRNGKINPVYVGNLGQIQLAKELGGKNLHFTSTFASAFDVKEALKWNVLVVPYKIAEAFLQLSVEPGFLEKYQGRNGLDVLTKEWSTTIDGLKALASGLGLARKLKWMS